jgi:hypothetical protein
VAKRRYLHTKHANIYRTLRVRDYPDQGDAIAAATRYALAISWVEGPAKRETAIRLDPVGRYWQVTVPVQVAR